MKHYVLLAAALLLFLGNAQAQSLSPSQTGIPIHPSKTPSKQEWYSRAVMLHNTLAKYRDKPATPALIQNYATLQRQLFPTRPYLSSDEGGPTLANTLDAQLTQWMADVKAGKYDDHFPR